MRSSNFKKSIGAIAIVALVLFIFGIRIEHPKAGLQNAIGSAQSSLVIVKKVNEIKPGMKIVAGTNVGKSPVLGIVASNKEGSIELHTGDGISRSTKDKVAGKLLMVIPFLGYPLNVIGL
ncbi:MAG: hypothetical protein RLZ57_1160 [Actinomycetota bacterium]|jgi:hypothetical protein